MSKNYYEILGVSPSATLQEIKKAFMRLALQHHPDKGGSVEKFREIHEAYNVLIDKQRKNNFPANFDGINDILEEIERVRVQNQAEMIASIEQAFILYGVSSADLDSNLWSGYGGWKDKIGKLAEMPVIDVPTNFVKFYTQLFDEIVKVGGGKDKILKKDNKKENFRTAEKEGLRKKHESLRLEVNSWENIDSQQSLSRRSKNYSPSLADDLDKKQNQGIKDLKQGIDEVKKRLDEIDKKRNRDRNDLSNYDTEKFSQDNINYQNWTKEQLISEINRLKAENEQLKNNQTLTTSERQEKLHQNQKELEKVQSLLSSKDIIQQPTTNNFPTSLVVSGGLLAIIGLIGLLIARKSKKKR